MSYCADLKMLNFIFCNEQILLKSSPHGEFLLPNLHDIAMIEQDIEILSYQDSSMIAIAHSDSFTNESLTFVNIRLVLSSFTIELANQIIRNKQFCNYYSQHRYCGTCGNKTKPQKHNLFVFCQNCHHEIYPNISPSIIVRIHKDEQILLARGHNFAKGVWGLVAGFVEAGETLEQAAHREVLEEVGLKIKNLTYFSSQPWPFPNNSLMVGFCAQYAGGEIKLQEEEIAEAGFFAKNNLPGRPSTPISIANVMIEDYLQSP